MQNNTKIKQSWKTLFTKYNNKYETKNKSLNNILDLIIPVKKTK